MENNNATLIRSVLTTEVKWILGVIMFVFGIAGPYYGITQDIALIQKDISIINSNHEVHIQDLVQTQKDQSMQILELQKQFNQLLITSNKN